MLIAQKLTAGVDLTVAILAGVVLLFLERLVSFILDIKRERRTAEHARKFLEQWFMKVDAGLESTATHYQIVLESWRGYLNQLELTPGVDLRSPRLPYLRIYMPDISDVVISASAYMPQAAYVNLLHLNSKLRVLDDRGRRLSDLFDHTLLKNPTYDRRVRIAKSVIEAVDYINALVAGARENSSDTDLKNWIKPKPAS